MLPILYLFVLAAVSADSRADDKDGSTTVSALKAGLYQWRQEIEFRSTFRVRKGFAKSVDAGLHDGIDPTLTGSAAEVFEAKGVCHKKGPRLRFSLDFGQPPVVISKASSQLSDGVVTGGGQRIVVNPSFDEVTDGRFQLRYEPGESGDIAYVDKCKPEIVSAGLHSATFINPLYPYDNPKFNPFELWEFSSAGQQAPTSVEPVSFDDTHIQVVLKSQDDWKQERRVRLWTGASPPVIDRIDEVISGPAGARSELHIVLSDFQQCTGGMVARKVLSVFQGQSGRAVVKEWISEDLGARPPTDGDFVVHIAPTTRVAGLKHLATDNESPRSIDITRLTETDLGNRLLGPTVARRIDTTHGRLMLLVNAGIVLAVIVVAVAYYIRKTGR